MARNRWVVGPGSTSAGEIVLASNARDFERWSQDLVSQQLPFAAATTLTKLAQLAAAKVKAKLGTHMTIRNERVPRGIAIVRAEKSDWPNPRAYVGDKDDFMVLQALGGTKRAKSGRMIIVPSKAALKQRLPTGAMSARVRAVIRSASGDARIADPGRRNPNIIRFDNRPLFADVLWYRNGKQRRTASRVKPEVMYSMRREQTVKARWPFREEAGAEAEANYAQVFAIEMEAAIRSRKVRGASLSSDGARASYVQALARVVRSLPR